MLADILQALLARERWAEASLLAFEAPELMRAARLPKRPPAPWVWRLGAIAGLSGGHLNGKCACSPCQEVAEAAAWLEAQGKAGALERLQRAREAASAQA